MKTIFWTVVLSALAGFASAETVLICHSQDLPPGAVKPALEASLVDAVFDALFESGDVAFDLGDAGDDTGDRARLAALAGRYGADKIVWFRLAWQPLGKDAFRLKSVTYRVLTGSGAPLAQGELAGGYVTPSDQDKAQIQKLTEAFRKTVVAAWSAEASKNG